MLCPKCSQEIPDNSNYCSHCGNKLGPLGVAPQNTAVNPSNVPLGKPTSTSIPVSTAASEAAGHEEETTIWAEYPSLRTAIPGLVGLLVGFIAMIFAISWLLPAKSADTSRSGMYWALFIVFGAAFVFVLAKHLIRLRSIRYRLSTQRMFIERGIFSKRTDEVELEHYKDVYVSQDFWDGLVGCGDIQILTGDSATPTIHIMDVVDPVAKKEVIRTAARERKIALGIMRREEL